MTDIVENHVFGWGVSSHTDILAGFPVSMVLFGASLTDVFLAILSVNWIYADFQISFESKKKEENDSEEFELFLSFLSNRTERDCNFVGKIIIIH